VYKQTVEEFVTDARTIAALDERLRRLLRHDTRVHRRCAAGARAGAPAPVSREGAESLLPTFRPRVQMLSEEFIDRIIDEAFEVLGGIGLQFEHPKALACSRARTAHRRGERAPPNLSGTSSRRRSRRRPRAQDLERLGRRVDRGRRRQRHLRPGSAAIKMLETDGRSTLNAPFRPSAQPWCNQLGNNRAASTSWSRTTCRTRCRFLPALRWCRTAQQGRSLPSCSAKNRSRP